MPLCFKNLSEGKIEDILNWLENCTIRWVTRFLVNNKSLCQKWFLIAHASSDIITCDLFISVRDWTSRFSLIRVRNTADLHINSIPRSINVIIVLNSSCGKVMFLHLSVILFTGGCLPLGPGGVHPRSPDRHPLPPPRDGHCSGRYASYWNAFLSEISVFCQFIYWWYSTQNGRNLEYRQNVNRLYS